MTISLTRRAAVTAAVATAAAPAAAAILGPVKPDPITAAIEGHRAASHPLSTRPIPTRPPSMRLR